MPAFLALSSARAMYARSQTYSLSFAEFWIGIDDAALRRRMSPDAGQAVCLQLQPHRDRVARSVRGLRASGLRVVHHAQLILDVMADFVRDDVGAGEIARSAETLRKLPEELE